MAPCAVFFSDTLGKAARVFSSDLVLGFGLDLTVTFITSTERLLECEEDEDEEDADEAGEGMMLGK